MLDQETHRPFSQGLCDLHQEVGASASRVHNGESQEMPRSLLGIGLGDLRDLLKMPLVGR